jgi:hypothetical protein
VELPGTHSLKLVYPVKNQAHHHHSKLKTFPLVYR